jgi:hypothetical protein
VTKNFRTILGAMMPAKVTIFSGGGPELCFIVLLYHCIERERLKKENSALRVSARRWFFRCARMREQKSESIREREKETSHVRSVLTAAREVILPGKKCNSKEQHTKERNVGNKVRKRTVGPALATMSTVSPLGTALTVPRSHPVTGMMRERMRTRSFPLKVRGSFCEEMWEEMASGFRVTSFKNTTHSHFSLCYVLVRM